MLFCVYLFIQNCRDVFLLSFQCLSLLSPQKCVDLLYLSFHDSISYCPSQCIDTALNYLTLYSLRLTESTSTYLILFCRVKSYIFIWLQDKVWWSQVRASMVTQLLKCVFFLSLLLTNSFFSPLDQPIIPFLTSILNQVFWQVFMSMEFQCWKK